MLLQKTLKLTEIVVPWGFSLVLDTNFPIAKALAKFTRTDGIRGSNVMVRLKFVAKHNARHFECF
jgi:hypothetical protein